MQLKMLRFCVKNLIVFWEGRGSSSPISTVSKMTAVHGHWLWHLRVCCGGHRIHAAAQTIELSHSFKKSTDIFKSKPIIIRPKCHNWLATICLHAQTPFNLVIPFIGVIIQNDVHPYLQRLRLFTALTAFMLTLCYHGNGYIAHITAHIPKSHVNHSAFTKNIQSDATK